MSKLVSDLQDMSTKFSYNTGPAVVDIVLYWWYKCPNKFANNQIIKTSRHAMNTRIWAPSSESKYEKKAQLFRTIFRCGFGALVNIHSSKTVYKGLTQN